MDNADTDTASECSDKDLNSEECDPSNEPAADAASILTETSENPLASPSVSVASSDAISIVKCRNFPPPTPGGDRQHANKPTEAGTHDALPSISSILDTCYEVVFKSEEDYDESPSPPVSVKPPPRLFWKGQPPRGVGKNKLLSISQTIKTVCPAQANAVSNCIGHKDQLEKQEKSIKALMDKNLMLENTAKNLQETIGKAENYKGVKATINVLEAKVKKKESDLSNLREQTRKRMKIMKQTLQRRTKKLEVLNNKVKLLVMDKFVKDGETDLLACLGIPQNHPKRELAAREAEKFLEKLEKLASEGEGDVSYTESSPYMMGEQFNMKRTRDDNGEMSSTANSPKKRKKRVQPLEQQFEPFELVEVISDNMDFVGGDEGVEFFLLPDREAEAPIL